MKASLFDIQDKKPGARFRLFCFPYAGGSALIFHNWSKFLPTSLEVCNIQLPGRDKTWQEASHTRLEPMVQAMAEEIKPLLDLPYAFFGHSMGALIAFELARKLREQRSKAPEKLMVSAARAPQDTSAEAPIHLLPQEQFIEALRTYNGIPAEIIENLPTMQLFLPRLRADFAVLETYQYKSGPPLECPLTAFGGSTDNIVSQESLSRWATQTRSNFSIHFFKGDHFFIHSMQEFVLKTICFETQPYL